MKARSFDRKFERGADLTKHLDLTRAKRSSKATKRVNVDFPAWMIESLDREADRVGVPRQSIIKMWLAERLEYSASHNRVSADAPEAVIR